MNKNDEPRGRPTLETVAKVAGVSKITVSRALRNSDLVRPDLREKIIEAARSIDYRMNAAARSLRTQRTHTVAVVMENIIDGDRPISDPLLLLALGGLLEVLTPAGYAMLLTTKEHFFASNAIDPDGVILLGQGENGQAVLDMAKSRLPVVVWGAATKKSKKQDPSDNIRVVGSDNKQGGQLAAGHLLAEGRERLLFLGDPAHPEVASRLEGVRAALKATTGAALVSIVPCRFSRQSALTVMTEILAGGRVFDAIIAVSDQVAAGACDALAAQGIAVPSDVAVIGFDDSAIAANHTPPLSSIRQDWSGGGRLLAETLLGILNGHKANTPSRLPVELIVRESSVMRETTVTRNSIAP